MLLLFAIAIVGMSGSVTEGESNKIGVHGGRVGNT
jgi:hypothetical protein